jgi:hypothetical protein
MVIRPYQADAGGARKIAHPVTTSGGAGCSFSTRSIVSVMPWCFRERSITRARPDGCSSGVSGSLPAVPVLDDRKGGEAAAAVGATEGASMGGGAWRLTVIM